MKKLFYLAVFAVFVAGFGVTVEAEIPTFYCGTLVNTDFSEVEDAPTEITSAEIVEANDGLPQYCQVKGYIMPNVSVEIGLPMYGWNGKFLKAGCGGYCGKLNAWVCSQCADPLKKGCAFITSDRGHKGKYGTWAYNNLQAEADFGFRVTHVATLAGKAINQHYYGKAPQKSYYHGLFYRWAPRNG